MEEKTFVKEPNESRDDPAEKDASIEEMYADANKTINAYFKVLWVVQQNVARELTLPLSLLPTSLSKIKGSILTLAGSQYIKGTLTDEALMGWIKAYASLGRFLPDSDMSAVVDRLADAAIAARAVDLDDMNSKEIREELFSVPRIELDALNHLHGSNWDVNVQSLIREFQTNFTKLIKVK